MEKLFGAFIETVTDKVMERLMATEKMKLFLEGVKDIPVQAGDIEGLSQFIHQAVNNAMDDFTVSASNIAGLDSEVEEHVETAVKNLLRDATVSFDI